MNTTNGPRCAAKYFLNDVPVRYSQLQVTLRAVLSKRPLNQTEIHRLHQLLIGDDRFTPIGYRQEDAFLGDRDHNNDPLPEFIGAHQEDVSELMLGLMECNGRLRQASNRD